MKCEEKLRLDPEWRIHLPRKKHRSLAKNPRYLAATVAVQRGRGNKSERGGVTSVGVGPTSQGENIRRPFSKIAK